MNEQAHILVVDDNAAGRYAVAHSLRQAGYRVSEVGTAQECFQHLANVHCDLVLLDIRLPDASGIEVCRELKRNPRTAGIPVIQNSAIFTAAHDRIQGLESGADAYLTSPFEHRELLAQVQALLRARRAEEAFRRTDERLRLAMDAAFLISFEWDIQRDEVRRFVSKDPTLSPPPVERPATFASVCQVVHPDDRDRFRANVQAALNSEGGLYECEFRIVRPDGSVAWLNERGRVERDPDGKPHRLLGLSQDITSRKQGEQALRESEIRLRLLSDNLPDSAVYQYVYEPGCSRRFLYVSAGIEKLNGIRAEDFLRDPGTLQSQLLPEYRPVLLEAEQRSARDLSDIDIEVPLRHPDGGIRWMRLKSRPRREPDGRIVWDGVQTDVTARKHAEEQLRQVHQRLQYHIQNTPLAVIEFDADFRLSAWSDGAQRVFGWEAAEVLGRTMWDLPWIHPDDRARVELVSKGLVSGLTPRSVSPNRNLRKDGSVVWCEWYNSSLLDETGKMRSVQSLVLDVTDRTRAEEALRESRDQFRTMGESVDYGVWRCDKDGCADYVSQSFLDLLNMSLEEMRDFGWTRRLPPQDVPAAKAKWVHSVRTGDPWEAEHRIFDRHGKLHTVLTRGKPVRDSGGAVTSWVGINLDISDRKRTEAALLESEKRLRLAKSAAQLGIHDYNPVTGELHWDTRLRELWGMGPDVEVNYDVFIKGVHPDDRPTTEDAVKQALSPAGDGHLYCEYRLVRGDQTRWLAATGQTTFENGKAIRLVGTVQDITQRREFQTELERLVADRTAKLQELVGELEHFSYTITHDMRAPLRSMRGFAELVQEACHPCGQHEQKLFLRRIIAAAERMDLLITDALSYSRAVRQDLPVGPVDLRALLRGMVDSYPEFQASSARIRLPDEIPLVLGNQAALTQCFSNLLGNAVKFVRPGATPDIQIRAELLPDGGAPLTGASGEPPHHWVRIWVQDKGIGIPESMRPRLFSMFAKGDARYEGTGIGLALVRKVVERMGGRVGVESELDKGSRFWVQLQPGDPRRRPRVVLPPEPHQKNML